MSGVDMCGTDYVQFIVIRKAKHVFATAECMGMDLPNDFAALLTAKFPPEEGYTIAARIRPNASRSVTLSRGL